MRPPLSHVRTIIPGTATRAGTHGAYVGLREGPAESRVVRYDLAGVSTPAPSRRSLLHLVQMTDIHVADTSSPGRLEFVERYFHHEGLKILLRGYRPQDFLTLHALESMVRTLNGLAHSPETGAPIQLALITGDLIDNGQENELNRALRLLAGGDVEPLPYEGVSSSTWSDDAYWHPEPEPGSDSYKRDWGFPSYPGLIDDAMSSFQTQGLRLPWLGVLGNHDSLMLGTAVFNARYEELVTGKHKPSSLPPWFDFDILFHPEHFLTSPEDFLSGDPRSITPDPQRRTVNDAALIDAHLRTPGLPAGHGFTSADCGYYVYDEIEGIRLIVLDTVNPAGHCEGSIGAAQLSWLEERLVNVHSRFRGVNGEIITTENADRLVVIVSHHELDTLTNVRIWGEVARLDAPRYDAATVEALLHRFPNVVLWLNGHTHRNRIHARHDPRGETGGFWEVTTSSLIDWPCQARLVELVDNGDGTLSILCTMVDHDAAPDPGHPDTLERLAAIHRELAANDPHAGHTSHNAGSVTDRTVDLRIRAPFPVA